MTKGLSEAQRRWLEDTARSYFNEHKDRVGSALLRKGLIRIISPSGGGFKAEYAGTVIIERRGIEHENLVRY